jgi:hypothetical protein
LGVVDHHEGKLYPSDITETLLAWIQLPFQFNNKPFVNNKQQQTKDKGSGKKKGFKKSMKT